MTTIIDFLHKNKITKSCTRFNALTPLFKFAREFHDLLSKCDLHALQEVAEIKKNGATKFLLGRGFVLPKKPRCVAFKYFACLEKTS